jgi:nucleotide-binding universal stress UspA family protein
MGTHGRKGLGRLFVGSVAATVVRAARVPVLVTPADPVNVARWASGDPLVLTVGLDGTAASEAALAWLGANTGTLPQRRFLIRLFWPPQEALRYGLPQPWLEVDPHPELVKLIDRDLRRSLVPLGGAADAQVRFRAAHVDGAQALAEEARLAGADAIVVGVSRNGLDAWNTLDVPEVLRHAPLPVLCLPEAAAPARREIPPVRTVLVASDLSDRANQSLPQAYALLRAAGGRVELVHVHVTQPLDRERAEPPLSDARKLELERQLRASIPPDAEGRGILTRISVLEGPDAAEALLRAARRLDVDVLALASHGRSGLKRAVLGSVAEQVARHSPRPVLIIHERAVD